MVNCCSNKKGLAWLSFWISLLIGIFCLASGCNENLPGSCSLLYEPTLGIVHDAWYAKSYICIQYSIPEAHNKSCTVLIYSAKTPQDANNEVAKIEQGKGMTKTWIARNPQVNQCQTLSVAADNTIVGIIFLCITFVFIVWLICLYTIPNSNNANSSCDGRRSCCSFCSCCSCCGFAVKSDGSSMCWCYANEMDLECCTCCCDDD